jgi:hypothetical protein
MVVYESNYRKEWLEGDKMIILEILTWVGIALIIVGFVLNLKVDDIAYAPLLCMGAMVILLSWTIALYDFGQLPPSFDWFRQLLI